MPTRTVRRKRNSRAIQQGKGVLDVLKKINNFARKTKLVSKVAGALDAAGVPRAGAIGNYAKQAGYGKVRKLKTG